MPVEFVGDYSPALTAGARNSDPSPLSYASSSACAANDVQTRFGANRGTSHVASATENCSPNTSSASQSIGVEQPLSQVSRPRTTRPVAVLSQFQIRREEQRDCLRFLLRRNAEQRSQVDGASFQNLGQREARDATLRQWRAREQFAVQGVVWIEAGPLVRAAVSFELRNGFFESLDA